MADYTNRTFDEIDVGASETVTRTLITTEVEALSLAAGDVESYHTRGADRALGKGPSTQGSAAAAILAGMLNRRLPGPGGAIIASQLQYGGAIHVGDTLTASVTARAKHADGHRIDFECRCSNQHGDVLAAGIVDGQRAHPPRRVHESRDPADRAAPQRRLRAVVRRLRGNAGGRLRRRAPVRSRFAAGCGRRGRRTTSSCPS